MKHDESSDDGAWQLLGLMIAIIAFVAFQQSYSKSHTYSIEQPVSNLGIAELLFRHPEILFMR